MTDEDFDEFSELAELAHSITEIDPFREPNGQRRSMCRFCLTMNQELHDRDCVWRLASAWRWRHSSSGPRK